MGPPRQNSKRASLRAVHFRDLEIRILNLFRISKFELRISKGKLDHFVNLVVTKKTQAFFGARMNKQTFPGEFELVAMLAVMRLGEAVYGVAIRREIEQRTGRSVSR